MVNFSKISDQLVYNLNNILSDENYKIWINHIGSDEVLVDGEFIRLKWLNTYLLSIKKKYSNYTSNKLFTVSNTIYTFFKCKYSITVAKLLKFIYKSINSYKSTGLDDLILNNFKKVKPYISKAIFKLFYFNELFQNIKSSDQTLLISLLNINTFLYSEHNTQYKRSKKYYDKEEKVIDIDDVEQHFDKLVSQLIYSLENYLCKYCIYSFKDLDSDNGQHNNTMLFQCSLGIFHLYNRNCFLHGG